MHREIGDAEKKDNDKGGGHDAPIMPQSPVGWKLRFVGFHGAPVLPQDRQSTFAYRFIDHRMTCLRVCPNSLKPREAPRHPRIETPLDPRRLLINGEKT
ncbi:hypothetical protein MACH05_03890 [Qipengyuania nanhaisediminis]